MNNIVVFDLEIKKNIVTGALDRPLNENLEVAGWGNSHKAGMSVGVLYDYQAETYRLYSETDIEKMVKRINEADFVVGFNHVGFDYKVVDFLSTGRKADESKDIDILKCIWKEVGRVKGTGLENIAQSTLGIGKSGDGALAPIIWQAGETNRDKIIELCDYCLQDVNVTKKLFDFIMVNGFVKKGDQEINLNSIVEKVNSFKLTER